MYIILDIITWLHREQHAHHTVPSDGMITPIINMKQDETDT